MTLKILKFKNDQNSKNDPNSKITQIHKSPKLKYDTNLKMTQIKKLPKVKKTEKQYISICDAIIFYWTRNSFSRGRKIKNHMQCFVNNFSIFQGSNCPSSKLHVVHCRKTRRISKLDKGIFVIHQKNRPIFFRQKEENMKVWGGWVPPTCKSRLVGAQQAGAPVPLPPLRIFLKTKLI